MAVFDTIKTIFSELKDISNLSAERKLFLITGALVIFLGWTSYYFYNNSEAKHEKCSEKIEIAIENIKTKYNSYIIECGENQIKMQQKHLLELDSLLRVDNSKNAKLDLIEKRLKVVEKNNKELKLQLKEIIE